MPKSFTYLTEMMHSQLGEVCAMEKTTVSHFMTFRQLSCFSKLYEFYNSYIQDYSIFTREHILTRYAESISQHVTCQTVEALINECNAAIAATPENSFRRDEALLSASLKILHLQAASYQNLFNTACGLKNEELIALSARGIDSKLNSIEQLNLISQDFLIPAIKENIMC